MSLYTAHNMRGESWLPGYCSICGRPYPERHHVVARSLGGHDGPLIHLCGCGNALYDADLTLLHHGAAEMHRLWFWWCDGSDMNIAPDAAYKVLRAWGMWAYLLSDDSIDWVTAIATPGWRLLV